MPSIRMLTGFAHHGLGVAAFSASRHVPFRAKAARRSAAVDATGGTSC